MLPIVIVGLVVVFQVILTWQLWKTDMYVRSEKSNQTKLIWLLPFLGAVFVLAMMLDEAQHHKRDRQRS